MKEGRNGFIDGMKGNDMSECVHAWMDDLSNEPTNECIHALCFLVLGCKRVYVCVQVYM